MPALAIIIWPAIACAIVKSLGRSKGFIWASLIGWLFLPEAFEIDLPGLPPLDKNMSIVLGLLLGLAATRPARAASPQTYDQFSRKFLFGLVILLMVSPILTILNNPEQIRYGPTVLPAMGLRDLITMTSQSLVFVIPFFIGFAYLSTVQSHKEILTAMVWAGLGYTLLVLFEIRMSPQLHQWVYGYFPTGWQMHIRGGNFRPIVFLTHGLFVGWLLMMCLIAAFTLLRARVSDGENRMQYFLIGIWFLGVLFLSRNTGATAIGFAVLPVLWFLKVRWQVWFAATIAISVMIYPALRQSGIVTLEGPVEFVTQLSPDRGQSLAFRVQNEEKFLLRINQKPISGWGLWARWRDWDPVTGVSASTSDGRWAGILGERGWLGYISYFGLLAAPLVLLLRTQRRQTIPRVTAGLAIIIATTLIYQLPNNTIRPIALLMVGAVAGFVCALPRTEENDEPTVTTSEPKGPKYTRFGPKTASDSVVRHARRGVG